MMLVIAVHFLDRFHGRTATGEREWPPSPLRLYQALLAAACGGGRAALWDERSAVAFRWLEQQAPPLITAPPTRDERAMLLYVPTNDHDLLAAAWARGSEPSAAAHRTAVTLQPQLILGDGTVRYCWPLGTGDQAIAPIVAAQARHLIALGHGEDLVVGDGWIGAPPDGQPRYVPRLDARGSAAPAPGLLDELRRRFAMRGRPMVLPPLRCVRALGYVFDTFPTRA